MRSSRTSNVKAKELAKKYTARRNGKAQTTDSKTVKVDPQQATPQQQGLVAPGPAAYNQPNEDGRRVSRDFAGDEIKRDADGEYDLEQVTGSSRDDTPAPRNISEQFIRGVLAPTEQFIQMPKDVIEGVKAEDQVMKETGLDLLITPLIKPFATAQNRGVTDKQWYSPIALITDDMARAMGFQDNNSLPTFLQNDGGDKRDFVAGMSDNIGAAGDVLGHESTYEGESSIGAGYEKSAERFMEAPAYYAGTVAGEIPYWFIGVGQVSAAAKVSVKAAQYSAKTGQVANPRLLAKAYKVEQAAKKLQTATNKENKMSLNKPEGKLQHKKEVLKAVKILKSGFGQQRDLIQKQVDQKITERNNLMFDGNKMGPRNFDPVKKKQLDDFIKAGTDDINKLDKKSGELDKYKKGFEEIEKLEGPDRKLKRITLNNMIDTDLLPKMKDYDLSYSKAVEDASANSRIKKLADKGVNLDRKIKEKFNPVIRSWGDSDSPLRKKDIAMLERVEQRRKEGYYNTEARNVDSDGVLISPEDALAAIPPEQLGQVKGIMGVLRYEKDLLAGAVESTINSKYSFIGRRRQRLQKIADTVSSMTVGLREFTPGMYKTYKDTVRDKRIQLEKDNESLSKSTSPEALKLLKSKNLFEKEYLVKLNKLEEQKKDLEEILETGMYEVPGGKRTDDVKKTKFVNADKQKIAETESMLDGITTDINDLKKQMMTNKGYQDTKRKIAELESNKDKAIVDDIARNQEEIKYLKEIEENPMKNVWWVTNPKSVGDTSKQTYIMDIDALQKAVPSIGEAWADTSIIQATRPSVSVRQEKGVIWGQVETTTNVGKGKNEMGASLSGDPQGMTFWVRDINKKLADKEFGKAFTKTIDGEEIVDQKGLDAYLKGSITKFEWRKVKGRRTAIPKREKMVRKIEFYKPADELQAAGQRKGVNAIYLLPKGLSEKEIQTYKEAHFLESYEGTDLPHLAFNQGNADLGNFLIFQERKLPKAYVEGDNYLIQVRAADDVKQKEKFLDASEIIENRKIAQNRYDDVWYQKKQESIHAAYTSLDPKKMSEDQYKTQLQLITRSQKELEKKRQYVKERQEIWRKMGVREIGDARGSVFSMPLGVLEDAVKVEGDSLYTSKFVDTKTNKEYYRGPNGKTYEVLDGEKFDPTRVVNREPDMYGEVYSDKSIKHTSWYSLGTSKPQSGGTYDMGRMTLAGQHVPASESKVIGYSATGQPVYGKTDPLFQTKGEYNEKLYATKEEAELTRAVRGEWEYDPITDTSTWVNPTISDSGSFFGLRGRQGPLWENRINLSIPTSYKNILRPLDKTEESQLYKGTILGKKIQEMTEGLEETKQYSVKKVEDEKTKTIKEEPNVVKIYDSQGNVIDVATRSYVWNNINLGGGILRQGVTNLNIKTRKKILSKTKQLSAKLNSDRLQWVRGRSDGLSDFQPLAPSDQSMSIFDNHRLIIGFGQGKAQNIRRMFATGDSQYITQGPIPGGVNIHSMYTFDTPWGFVKQEKVDVLAKSEKASAEEKANMLKSQKLDTFDKLEAIAARETGIDGTSTNWQKQHEGANKLFREKVVELYYRKVLKTKIDQSEVVSKAKNQAEYLKIKNEIKDKNLIKTVTIRKSKRSNVITPADFGPRYTDGIKYDDGVLMPRGFIERYTTRLWGHLSGTRAQDLDIKDLQSGRFDRLKDTISKKKDTKVENADPRTKDAYVKALEELRDQQGGTLNKINQKVYDELKGSNLTSEQGALKVIQKRGDKTEYGNVIKKDGEVERLGNEEFGRDTVLDQYKQFEDRIESREGSTGKKDKREGPYKKFVDNTEDLSDDEFYQSVKALVFEEAGLPLDTLYASRHLSPSAEQILIDRKLKSKVANKKGKNATNALLSNVSNSVKDNIIGPPVPSPQLKAAMQKLDTAAKTWQKVSEKTSERVNPVDTDKITGAMQRQQGSQGSQQAPPTTLMSGVQSLFAGAEMQIPQAYAEESKLTTMSNTVTSSFDDIVKGGVKISTNINQNVKMSDSQTGGILGVNQNLIPQQNIQESSSFALTLPTVSATTRDSVSHIVPQTQEAAALLSSSYTTFQSLNQVLSAGLREGSMVKSNISQNPRVIPTSFQRVLSPPMTPRVIPGPLPIIPLTPYGRPIKQRPQRRYKKKSGKAYWQTPQNWYDPYYWGGKDQLGSGYIVFKGKEPAKVRKYDQKYFGMDLGNLW